MSRRLVSLRSLDDRGMRRGRAAASALLALSLVAALAACANDPLAEQYRSGDNKGYIAGDQRIVEIPSADRGEPVVFEGTTETGETVTSDDYAGDVLVVNFWYAACGPCRVEAPELEKAYAAFADEDVAFLGINTQDSASVASAFADTYGVTYPSALAAKDGALKLSFAQAAPLSATPVTLVLDQQGRVAARVIGELPDASILKSLIRDTLAESVNPVSIVADGALWIALPLALVAGLLSFLSPCVLPLVPGYLGFIGGAVAPRPVDEPRSVARTSEDSGPILRTSPDSPTFVQEAPSRSRLLVGVLLFIAGFTVVFMAMTILGGTLGQFFFANSDLITRILGVVVIALGLVFVGLFGFAQRTVHPQVRGNVGLIGAPLLGVALGIGWTPCIGPTLGAIISVSWNLGDPGRAALLGLAYSLGLGVPFILITLGFGWATRSVGFLRRHIRAVNIIGGVLLIVLGVLMVSGVWSTWMAELQGVLINVPLPL